MAMLQTATLGHTKHNITPLGLGLAALGRPGYITLGHADDLQHTYDITVMEAHAHRVLDAAWAAGIRYFDTARSYGRAEQFLGTWLAARQIDPAQITIGSKWGYTYTADWQVTLAADTKHEVKEHSRPVLQRQIAESRDLLGAHLDLYQIHSATLDSGVLENAEVLAVLGQLRDEGLAIGFSVSGPKQAETILRGLAIEVGGKPLFAAVQATWNLLEQSATAALRQAHEAGVGVIVKEVLANGRLTARNRETSFQDQLMLLTEVAQSQQTTVDALALATVMQQTWVNVALSGAATIDHLHANLAALQVTWNEGIAERLAGLRESATSYWHARGQLAWN